MPLLTLGLYCDSLVSLFGHDVQTIILTNVSIGYPVITFYGPYRNPENSLNFGANATGQIPQIVGNHGLIDEDTPQEAYTRTSWNGGSTEMQLVFSDEFNTDGRSFYPGDDPYWEAVDLRYWVSLSPRTTPLLLLKQWVSQGNQ